VRKICFSVLPALEKVPDATFVQAGMSSFEAVEIAEGLRREFPSIHVTHDIVHHHDTLNSLLDAIRKQVKDSHGYDDTSSSENGVFSPEQLYCAATVTAPPHHHPNITATYTTSKKTLVVLPYNSAGWRSEEFEAR